MFRHSHATTTGKDGKFTFERMFPGRAFHLFVLLPGHRTGSGSVTDVKLKPGEAKDAGDIKLRDPKKVEE
jgi:hypothetical protein